MELIGRCSIETGMLTAACYYLCVPAVAIACHEAGREITVRVVRLLDHIPMFGHLCSIPGDR